MLLPKLDNNTWSTLAIESVLIVLSVILGFLVTEWRQTQENEARATSAKESVLAEITENYRQVTNAQAYHTMMRDSLQAYRDSSYQSVRKLVFRHQGIFDTAEPQSVAWMTAQSTEAMRLLSFDTVKTLSYAYQHHDVYHREGEQVGDIIRRVSIQEGDAALFGDVDRLLRVVDRVRTREGVLLRRYKQVLDTLDRPVPDVPTDTLSTDA